MRGRGSSTSRSITLTISTMSELDDTHISVRFKHGIHTIYLFADSLAPVSSITEELLALLRERYPHGLTTSNQTDPPTITQVPAQTDLAYAVLAVPNDPSKGWRRLKVGERSEFTPTKAGMKDNSIVAIAFVEGQEEDDVKFEVEWPQDDVEEEEEE